MLTHFNHLSQLTFLFIEAGILFLLLSELRGGVEELLEVLRITSILEKVNLGQELLLLLLKALGLSRRRAGVGHPIVVVLLVPRLLVLVRKQKRCAIFTRCARNNAANSRVPNCDVNDGLLDVMRIVCGDDIKNRLLHLAWLGGMGPAPEGQDQET